MSSWLPTSDALLGGLVLTLIQVVAALPWLRAIDPKGFARTFRSGQALGSAALVVAVVAVLAAVYLGFKGESSNLPFTGRVYGAVLHLQLLIDAFILVPVGIARVWPKGGAVALAAYREGWRQPMFWLVAVFGVLLTWVAVVLPYFTFGDDYKMFKQIGMDITMLAAVLFGVLAASISISEEIEGRTAITLMSKPINRRQFLVGKFLGILMACAGLSLLLGWNLNWALLASPEFDPINKDRAFDAMPAKAKDILQPAFRAVAPPYPTAALVRDQMQQAGTGWPAAFAEVAGRESIKSPARTVMDGAGMWFGESFAHALFILLGFGQVMILVAIATALATRLPFVINLVLCLMIYFLGHLAPVVVKVTEKAEAGGTTGAKLVGFLGNLFDTILPGLDFFNGGPAIIRETPLDLWPFAGYVVTVFGYAALYTVIALLVGLLLFEDRDLA